jgi:hypothetical protein
MQRLYLDVSILVTTAVICTVFNGLKEILSFEHLSLTP